MIKIAHLSDCHIGPLPRVKLSQLVNKRFTGYWNWRRHRSHIHKKEVLNTVCSDMLSQAPDHIAVTGDLVNLALPHEYQQALDWLKTLGNSADVSLVPGNHDAYVRFGKDGMNLWKAYMQSDEHGKDIVGNHSEPFPFVRHLGNDVFLIGLSSAVPTPFFMATGKMGMKQREKFGEIVQILNNRNCFCLVLIHHPPLPGMTKRIRALSDAKSLKLVLGQIKSGLVLHGHDHQNSKFTLETEHGKLPVIGVASASCAIKGKEPLARYNMFEIDRTAENWTCIMTGRGLDVEDGEVAELERTHIL